MALPDVYTLFYNIDQKPSIATKDLIAVINHTNKAHKLESNLTLPEKSFLYRNDLENLRIVAEAKQIKDLLLDFIMVIDGMAFYKDLAPFMEFSPKKSFMKNCEMLQILQPEKSRDIYNILTKLGIQKAPKETYNLDELKTLNKHFQSKAYNAPAIHNIGRPPEDRPKYFAGITYFNEAVNLMELCNKLVESKVIDINHTDLMLPVPIPCIGNTQIESYSYQGLCALYEIMKEPVDSIWYPEITYKLELYKSILSKNIESKKALIINTEQAIEVSESVEHTEIESTPLYIIDPKLVHVGTLFAIDTKGNVLIKLEVLKNLISIEIHEYVSLFLFKDLNHITTNSYNNFYLTILGIATLLQSIPSVTSIKRKLKNIYADMVKEQKNYVNSMDIANTSKPSITSVDKESKVEKESYTFETPEIFDFNDFNLKIAKTNAEKNRLRKQYLHNFILTFNLWVKDLARNMDKLTPVTISLEKLEQNYFAITGGIDPKDVCTYFDYAVTYINSRQPQYQLTYSYAKDGIRNSPLMLTIFSKS